jgi:cell wall-associated NlpC family hydrolase
LFLIRHWRAANQNDSHLVRAAVARLARAAGATALGVTAGFAGSSSPTASSATNLAAAESVAASVVGGFESFSYQDPGTKSAVTDLATPGLAAQLASPSQAATGPALVAEKYTAVAHVVGFVVESDTATTVDLLARTTIHITTVKGSDSSTRLVPVSLVLTAAVWKVAGVDGLSVSSPASAPPTTVPSGTAPSTTTTTTTTGGTTGATNGAPGASTGTPPPVTAVGDVPADYVGWMKAAVAAECPSLSWTVLAGIAKVESDFGKSTLPGVRSGSNPMGAEGPMQFEPATFAAYDTLAPGGADPASPYDPADAIYSAARLLCSDGGGNPARLYSAIFDYNHSDAYVSLVLAYSAEYAQMASDGGTERGLGSVIVADAETYLGTPYVWGGESPGHGFDCSGLVQWVYAEAGITLPRVAQDQYDAGPHVPAGATLYPGDLVFFGSGPSAVEHVGIYVGNGDMIDAPYTGAVVRFDRVASVPLGFVGATRPEIPDLTGGAGVPVIGTSDGPSSGESSGGHQSTGHSQSSSDGGAGHHMNQSTGVTPPGRRRTRSTSSTEPPGPNTIRPGRHHPIGTTTTTTTTAPVDTTTSTTVPGTTTRPGRHHQTTTTTTVPTTTTTTTASAPPTTTPSATTTTTTASAPTTTVTTTASADSATTTTPPAGRHHKRNG